MILHHAKLLRPKHLRARRGIVNVWVVLTALILIAMLGLACDTAYVNLVGQQLQNAADAAALAGAEEFLKKHAPEDAMAAAASTAAQNYAGGAAVSLVGNPGNGTTGDIVVGTYTRSNKIFTPTMTDPNAVQVLARRTAGSPGGNVTLFFAPMFGVRTSEISRSATAMLRVVYPAILVLDPHGEEALLLKGTPQVEVTQNIRPGAVVVNSDADNALKLNTNSSIDASEIDVVGGIDSGIHGWTSSTPAYERQSPVTDPLANLPAPDTGTTQNPAGYKTPDGKTHFLPGHYTSITLGKDNVFDPGIFVFDTNVTVGGSTNLTALGVMIYMKTGDLTLGGTGQVTLWPPTTGTWAGVGIFQARTNTGTVTINGTPDMHILGTIYIPGGTMVVGGEPGTIGNQLIVYRLQLNGTSTVHIDYDGRNPAPGRIFLVK